MYEEGEAHDGDCARNAARNHGEQLLVTRADQPGVGPMRGQHAKQMAEEDEQHAEVKEVRAPAQLTCTQQLRAVALPGVLIAIEANEARKEKHRETDIRIDSKQELIQTAGEGHGGAPSRRALRGMNRSGVTPGSAAPPAEPGPNAGCSIQSSSTCATGGVASVSVAGGNSNPGCA